MTYYIDIDVAKFVHVACVVDAQGSTVIKPFSFNNSKEGFELLLSTIQTIGKHDIVFGFESTAHYHENLMYFIQSNNFDFKLINPIRTKRFRGLNIRDVKNDKVDSHSIALYLAFNHSSEVNTHSLYLDNLYQLSVERDDLKAKRTREYIRLTAYLDRVFPELKPFLGTSIKTKGVMQLLKTYSTAAEIRQLRVDRIQNLLNTFRSCTSRERVLQIKTLASNSIGFHTQALSLCIKSTILQIELISQLLDAVEEEIMTIMKELNSPVLQIPGMGYIQAATIVSVIGDINRFEKPEQLVAYAGLDPKVRQSGSFVASSTRMSKRGNKLLRYSVIWSAYNATRHSNTMRTYYDKKRAENKSHYNALGHCGKKLLHYIFFVLKNPETPFILE